MQSVRGAIHGNPYIQDIAVSLSLIGFCEWSRHTIEGLGQEMALYAKIASLRFARLTSLGNANAESGKLFSVPEHAALVFQA